MPTKTTKRSRTKESPVEGSAAAPTWVHAQGLTIDRNRTSVSAISRELREVVVVDLTYFVEHVNEVVSLARDLANQRDRARSNEAKEAKAPA
jgi:hypothetical protein